MPSLTRIVDHGLPFVGRRQELAQIEQYFTQNTRLITLFGGAGFGKTRLAMHFISTLSTRDPAMRTYIGELSTAQNPDEMLATLVRTWLIESPPGQSIAPEALIARWINTRGNVIVLLDNFEQLVESSARIIDEWLKLCPHVTFLITSRHKLALAGERVVEVGALAVPPVEVSDPQLIVENESVRLFLQCGNIVLDQHSVTIEHANLLRDVVRHLEGNALAIALAAARLEVMTLRVLRERLNERFELLRNPTVKSTDRHATLYAAIDWSWSLLSTMERSILAQLSVFEGGFTVEAAEAVAVLPVQNGDRVSVLDIVHSLSRKSLLQPSSMTGLFVEPRFSMHSSIAEYVVTKLRNGEVNVTEHDLYKRFAQWILTFAQTYSARVDQSEGAIALQHLLAEYHNIQAFLRATLAQPPREETATQLLTLAFALDPVLLLRTPTDTACELLGQILRYSQQVPAITTTKIFADVLTQRAIVLRYQGHLVQALQSVEQAQKILVEHWPNEHASMGRCLRLVASNHYLRNEIDAAKINLLKAKDEYARSPTIDMCAVDATLGMIALDATDIAVAEQYFNQAVALAKKHGSARWLANMLGNQATFQAETGELMLACRSLEQALAIHREFGSRRNEAVMIGQLSVVNHLRGQLDEADKGYQQAVTILNEVGDVRYQGYMLYYAAMVAIERGQFTTASSLLQQAQVQLQTVSDPRYEALVVAAKVAVLAQTAPKSVELVQQVSLAKQQIAKLHDKKLALIIDIYSALVDAVTEGQSNAIALALDTIARLDNTPADDVRLALRLLRKVVIGQENLAKTWSFGAGSIWFQAPGQLRVSLENRGTVARILDILVKARMQTPGVALSIELLSQHAWPDTKLVKEAIHNRVHVALSTLRKLGLEPMIVRTRLGYHLDDQVPIQQETT